MIAECSHPLCFSMSRLELSYSKGHNLCLSTVTRNAVSLVIDGELGIVLLETCRRFLGCGLLFLLLCDSSSHSLVRKNCVIHEAVLKCG